METPGFPTSAFQNGSMYLSGTVHKAFRLGQKITGADLAIEEDRDDAPLTVGRKGAPTRKPGATGTGVRGTASLKDLVDAGVLIPGKNKVTCVYKGMTAVATLAEDGAIEYQGKRYNSATAFSIHYKRQITPSKQGDDGWKSVCYDGRPLEHYRKIYLQQLSASMRASQQGNSAGNGATPGKSVSGNTPASRKRAASNMSTPTEMAAYGDVGEIPAAAEGADADRWVQCEKCETWRLVPAEDWESVQNDPREEWYCGYATWDVQAQPPFTTACM